MIFIILIDLIPDRTLIFHLDFETRKSTEVASVCLKFDDCWVYVRGLIVRKISGNNVYYLPSGNNVYYLPSGKNVYYLPSGNNVYYLPSGNNVYYLPSGNNVYYLPLES